jgi:hypothetical protein
MKQKKMDTEAYRIGSKPFGLIIEMQTGCQKKGCSVVPFALPYDPDLAHDIEPTKRKSPLQKAA